MNDESDDVSSNARPEFRWIDRARAGRTYRRPVFGTGGYLGFLRDGSHAEYLVVPVEAIVPRPDGSVPSRRQRWDWPI